jgi:DNA-binding transcriptional ArsR family regulator
MKQSTDIQDPQMVKALAHPLRVRALAILRARRASPSEIAEELGMPLTNVSYHIRVLADNGLIRLVSRTPKRGVIEHHYEVVDRLALTGLTLVLDDDGFTELASELSKLADRARRIQERSQARLRGAGRRGRRPAGLVMMLFERKS